MRAAPLTAYVRAAKASLSVRNALLSASVAQARTPAVVRAQSNAWPPSCSRLFSTRATPPSTPPPTSSSVPPPPLQDTTNLSSDQDSQADDKPAPPPASLPRRAMLYVPGSSEKMIKRALGLQVDALIFDLEDSVAMHRKNVARETVMYGLGAAPRPGPELLVRINPPSGDATLAQDDLDVVLPSTQLHGLVLPKVESANDIRMVIERAESLRPNLEVHSPLSLVLSIESAASLLSMQSILQEVKSWNKSNIAYVAALLFASEDYCASTGIVRTKSRRELLFPRAQMATIAKAHQLEAIDMVCVDYKDEAYLVDECQDGRELGYDGKQAIHPSQITAIHQAFSPSAADIEWAARIRHAYLTSIERNQGAVGLQQGNSMVMIDAPMLKQAETTLAKAQAADLPITEIESKEED